MNIYVLSLGFMVWTLTECIPRVSKVCEANETDGKCEMNWNVNRLTCASNLSPVTSEADLAEIVYICHWSGNHLDPVKIMRDFPEVKKLSITNGKVENFPADFPRSIKLSRLTLSNLGISIIRPSLFANLKNLEFLDLSHNELKRVPWELISRRPSLSRLVLIGNPWDCSADFDWILNKSISSRIPNKNLLRCGEGIYAGKPVYTVMSFIRKMEKDCPRNICSCVMNNIVWNTQQSHLIPVITANCSNRGLDELPAKLPVNTTTLLLAGNNIKNLLPLIRNKIYAGIADIYLDNNQITSIDVLEGALWLKKFRVFSLRGNNLTQLPIYALDNAFERNTNMVKIYLGLNPWKCDCTFTPDFQHFLIKYRSLVKDQNDVTCAQVEDNENSNLQQIKTLSTNSLCRKQSHQMNPLDILSAVFASLILIILGKLLFDWWTFRRTGKLPWIAAKMPC